MMAARDGQKCFITGSSTRNQRIERMWRDLMRSALDPFYATFE